MKNLFLSSFFIVLIIGCSPTHGYKLNKVEVITNALAKPVINKNNSLLYKAKINLYNKYYSGLILVKRTDSTTEHLVFVTELGIKMFDFEIKKNEFKLAYVFEPLNKPKILKLLEHEMKLLLLKYLSGNEAEIFEKREQRIYKVRSGNYKHYYYIDTAGNKVNKTIVKGNLLVKEKVNYMYDADQNVKQIKLKHKGIVHLKIELNNISK